MGRRSHAEKSQPQAKRSRGDERREPNGRFDVADVPEEGPSDEEFEDHQNRPFEKRMAKLKSKYNTVRSTNKELHRDVAILIRRMAEKDEILVAANQQLEEINKQLKELQNVEEYNTFLSHQTHNDNIEIENQKDEIARMQKSANENDAKLQELKIQLSETNREIENLKDGNVQLKVSNNKIVEQKSKDIKILERNWKEAKNEARDLKSELERTKRKLEHMESDKRASRKMTCEEAAPSDDVRQLNKKLHQAELQIEQMRATEVIMYENKKDAEKEFDKESEKKRHFEGLYNKTERKYQSALKAHVEFKEKSKNTEKQMEEAKRNLEKDLEKESENRRHFENLYNGMEVQYQNAIKEIVELKKLIQTNRTVSQWKKSRSNVMKVEQKKPVRTGSVFKQIHKNLEARYVKLKKQLEDELKLFTEESQNLKDKIEEAEKYAQTAQYELEQATKVLDITKTEFKKEKDSLNDKLKQSAQKTRNTNIELERVKKELKDTTKTLGESREDRQNLTKELEEATRKNEEIKHNLTKELKDSSRKSTEIKLDAEKRYASLTIEIVQLEQDKERLMGEIEFLKGNQIQLEMDIVPPIGLEVEAIQEEPLFVEDVLEGTNDGLQLRPRQQIEDANLELHSIVTKLTEEKNQLQDMLENNRRVHNEEVANLTEQKIDLINELKESESIRQNLQEQLFNTTSELKHIKDLSEDRQLSIAEKTSDIKRLESELLEAQNALERQQEREAANRQENDDLRAELNVALCKNKLLEEKNSKGQDELDNLELIHDQLKNKYEKLQKSHNKSKLLFDTRKAIVKARMNLQMASIKEEKEKLQELLDGKVHDMDLLNIRCYALYEEVKTMEESKKLLEDEHLNRQLEKDQLIKELELQVKQVKADLVQAKEDFQRKVQRLDSTQNEFVEVHTKNLAEIKVNFEKSEEDHKKQLASMVESHQEILNVREQTIERLFDENKQLLQMLGACQTEKEEAEKTIRNLRERIEVDDREKDDNSRKLNDLQEEVESLQVHLKKCDGVLTSLGINYKTATPVEISSAQKKVTDVKENEEKETMTKNSVDLSQQVGTSSSEIAKKRSRKNLETPRTTIKKLPTMRAHSHKAPRTRSQGERPITRSQARRQRI